jgi:hypothetical protein
MLEENMIEHVISFNNIGNKISEYKKDMIYKLQHINRINGIIKIHFGKQKYNKHH